MPKPKSAYSYLACERCEATFRVPKGKGLPRHRGFHGGICGESDNPPTWECACGQSHPREAGPQPAILVCPNGWG